MSKKDMIDKIKLLLKEQDEAPTEAGVDTPDTALALRSPSTKARPAKDSVDDQIDALILEYESRSIRSEASLNESLKNLSLRYLFEQDEEEPDLDVAPAEDPTDDAVPDEGDAPEEQDPAGSDDMTVTEPAGQQKTPDLDVDAFTTRAMRLIKNYQNLLTVEEAIINRFKSFLDENYGEVFVSEFMQNLDQRHGIVVGENELPEDEVQDPPLAVGAFAGGTGGLAGGG